MWCGIKFPFLVISQKGNFFVKIFLVWGSKIAFLGNSFFGKFPILEGGSRDLVSLFGNFDGLHKRLKNHFGMVFPKKEILMDDISKWWTHIPKKEILMAGMTGPEIILQQDFLFWKVVSTKITKKGNFDGLYKHPKNHFGTGISFFGNSDGLHK